jgi:hypothetical protein
MDDILDLPAQDRAAADKAARERRQRETEAADIEWLMSSERGRRIMRGLFDRVGVPTGDAFHSNALIMARNLGMQEVGRYMLVLIEAHCPGQYVTMVREGKEVK